MLFCWTLFMLIKLINHFLNHSMCNFIMCASFLGSFMVGLFTVFLDFVSFCEHTYLQVFNSHFFYFENIIRIPVFERGGCSVMTLQSKSILLANDILKKLQNLREFSVKTLIPINYVCKYYLSVEYFMLLSSVYSVFRNNNVYCYLISDSEWDWQG